ncbi:GyrI-like domain-containing protein [Rossellomorea vietnamensis]|uniref:GyrI-like domain-containing protein n=1 Tax=Rossellomorea vietnamensis TaxID=218284 RepID=UPI001CCBC205|nr:GyrI-like domain-containing protein [Rossellomorea vietnamensis]MCA0149530.1 GyrI-like domain-containing protein [Rossellomorea vietnamensis]
MAELKSVGEVKLVGFRVVCPGDEYVKEIPKAAVRLQERKGEIQNALQPDQQIGAFIVEESSPEEDGYWIGLQVKEYGDIPTDMTSLTIPAHTYGTILHQGPNHDIRQSYEQLHQWIHENGYTRSTKSWNLEIYQKENQPGDPSDVRVELYDAILTQGGE